VAVAVHEIWGRQMGVAGGGVGVIEARGEGHSAVETDCGGVGGAAAGPRMRARNTESEDEVLVEREEPRTDRSKGESCDDSDSNEPLLEGSVKGGLEPRWCLCVFLPLLVVVRVVVPEAWSALEAMASAAPSNHRGMSESE